MVPTTRKTNREVLPPSEWSKHYMAFCPFMVPVKIYPTKISKHSNAPPASVGVTVGWVGGQKMVGGWVANIIQIAIIQIQ